MILWSFPRDFEADIKSNDELALLNSYGITGEIYTGKTPLKATENGFLVFVRNKLASEYIFFNERSNDHFNSYVTGFFYVDCIDEFKEDLISTARQSILWDSNPDILAIRNALDKLVRIIGMQWREKRKTKKEKSLDLSDEFFEGLSPVEKEAIIKVKNTLLVNSPDVDDITTIKSVLENMRVLFQFRKNYE